MAQCARCSVDIGEGGVSQEDGARLCGACDLAVNGPVTKVTNPLDSLMPDFCPKCNSVWDKSSPTCAKCNWDVIALRHVFPKKAKEEKVARRIWVDPVAIGLAVFFLIAGYIVFDRYRAHAREQKQEAEQQVRDEEARKDAEAKAAKVREEEFAKRQAEEQARQEKLRKEREEAQIVAVAQLKQRTEEAARVRAQQDAERKEQMEAAKLKLAEDLAARDKKKKDAEEARRLDRAARAAMSRETRIAEFTQELKETSDIIRKQSEIRDLAQRQMNTNKSKVDVLQRQLDILKRSLANVQAQRKQAATQAAQASQAAAQATVDGYGRPKRGTGALSTTIVGESDPMAEQERSLAAKVDATNAELVTADRTRVVATDRAAQANAVITDTVSRMDAAKAGLADLGIDPQTVMTKVVSGAVAAPTVPRPVPVKIYTLKDGRVIRATTAIISGDEISLKQENAGILVIKKDDVQALTTEDAAPAP
jgi:hypothetical protein